MAGQNISLRALAWLLVALPVLLSGGCAVISEDQCQAGLWYERGLQDGARGRSQALIYEIAQECQQFGVRVDSEAWLRGHEMGVEQFCTPENGYYLGRRGHSYEGVCTGPTADLFMGEYQRGLAHFQVEQQYRKLQERQDYLEYELGALQAAIRKEKDESRLKELRLQRRAVARELRHINFELLRFGGAGFDLFF
ncbi:DUF2799 domain-containing protein [Microbulbifer guangxiensis]|uniref:DUF2799 domain-containing protein n=1 Tax=Microbulbifer guangxiensis TaxID=2904249 RepID=UPI001F21C467|nr:DUF2799 domain-containing protein [Microbulbifer guangxiensis]